MTFDARKDFGEVFSSGAKFYQEGKFYDAKHNEVTEDGEPVVAEVSATETYEDAKAAAEATKKEAEAAETIAQREAEEAQEAERKAAQEAEESKQADIEAQEKRDAADKAQLELEVATEVVKDDLDKRPWQTIKKLVEEAGGVWKDKKAGLAYLRGE